MKVAILSGSVYGTAEEVARHAERQLKAAGLDAWHKANVSLEAAGLRAGRLPYRHVHHWHG